MLIALIAVGCGRSASYRNISPAEVQERMEAGENLILIDVRESWEYTEGRIPGAVLFPLGDLKENYTELDKNAEIILVCRSGNRSGQAAAFLTEKGYTDVYNLVGGMLAWEGPVERGL
ncbi:MAG: rhodanese-like domain-containing protein [Bacillota bacterium]|nr:rhodanese-like domain-containing protein [Bacillota bacterium]MDW7683723.1 rhodanese-like domain-containing protein [Bacillota bacterium]